MSAIVTAAFDGAGLPQFIEKVLCINDILGDDELRSILLKLESHSDKEKFGFVCKRWLQVQSSERKKICARAGPDMLRRLAGRFTRLVELDLSQSPARSFYPGVSDSDLSVIAASFSCLRVLNLHNCKGVTDDGMKAIGTGLSILQSLDVSECRKLTDKGLSSVAHGCHDLRILRVAGCRFITDKLLEDLSRNCACLEDLGLQGCSNISDFGLVTLVEGCKKLKCLDINKCSKIGDRGICSVARACSTSLKTLKLLDCSRVTNESVLILAEFCRNLESLIIGGCKDISDESMSLLASACCSNLQSLRMDWCLNISDSSLDCILRHCSKLEVLDVGCCEQITDAAFQGLGSEYCKIDLKIFKFSNCPKITVVGIAKLLSSCNHLEYLDARSCPHVTKAVCEDAGLQFPASCKVNFSGNVAEPDVLF